MIILGVSYKGFYMVLSFELSNLPVVCETAPTERDIVAVREVGFLKHFTFVFNIANTF